MMEFKEAFDKLCYTRDASTVWTDFLNYSIDQFLINPHKKYFHHEKYEEEDYKHFQECFFAWIHGMEDSLKDNQWYDLLGELYEDIIISSYKAGAKGQFFTPPSVTNAMTSTVNTIQEKENGNCMDCACGSGRLLLAWHIHHPRALCFGEDVDEQAAKMCVLNFLVHGVKGSVLWGNSLSGELFDAWKIHEFPFTIMSVDNVWEAKCFIGESIHA